MSKRLTDEFEFRVIAGELKGRRITAPRVEHTRPPLSRLRKAIFDFLNPYLMDAAYLDLFSGTGSYLFEAVSRGVAKALGIELDPALVASITHQAEQYRVADRLDCRRDDVFAAITRLHEAGQKFNIIMVAPPQYQDMVDRTLVSLQEYPLSTTSGIIVCQHDSVETRKIDFGSFTIDQHRKYGNTTFTVLRTQQ